MKVMVLNIYDKMEKGGIVGVGESGGYILLIANRLTPDTASGSTS